MDLGLSEQQEMLKKSARDFLAAECPKKLVRELDASDIGYSPKLWRKMADLGWMGIAYPEKYGGNGGTFLDLGILLEEMGYNLVPGPFFSTVVLGGLTILDAGSKQQKEKLLSRVSSGELIMTLSLTELDGTFSAPSLSTIAVEKGEQFQLNGTKLFVPDANIARYILVVARTRIKGKAESGITILLVDTGAQGITITPLKTLANDKLCEVIFDNVIVPKANIIGQINKAWPVVEDILRKAAVAKCLEMVGMGQASLDMAVNYAKERVQFGHPIGSFQAIQHHCANMVTFVDSARFLAYKAAWAISESLDCNLEVAMAKTYISEAVKRVTALAHQIFGAVGFTMDHDMHLYYRRAKSAELAFGDADLHRNVVAHCIGL